MQAIGVVFGTNPKVYYYEVSDEHIQPHDAVVVTTARGVELATVVQGATDKKDKEIEKGEILRLATAQDILDYQANIDSAKALIPEIKEVVRQQRLDMKICGVEYTLDKSKIIITYTAEDRVDFRELLKVLGAKYKARIEMRQVGNRDEVQYVGAMGICGRECCCKGFLGDFDKVSIKMAKNQGIALNPSKINGACGRLLCCLKYEDEAYKEILARMPKVNSMVITPDGKGKVVYNDILREKVTVSFERGEDVERTEYALADIKFTRVTVAPSSDDDE